MYRTWGRGGGLSRKEEKGTDNVDGKVRIGNGRNMREGQRTERRGR